MPKALPGFSGERLPGRSTEEAGREEEEETERSGERRIRQEIAQEEVEGIKEKASAHEDAKSTVQKIVGQSVKQNWDSSQIENEEEEEEEDWEKKDQMEVHWAEDEKLEEILEQRRREGSSLKAEVMQKVPELVLHERMSQGGQARDTEEKKKIKGWSTEDMRENQAALVKKTQEI